MKLEITLFGLLQAATSTSAWILRSPSSSLITFSTRSIPRTVRRVSESNYVEASETPTETTPEDATEAASQRRTALTADLISKLRFRELRHELASRELDADGTTSQLRDRLREVIEECKVDDSGDLNQACEPKLSTEMEDLMGIEFIDQTDPDFEYKELVREVMQKSEMGHWKAATRKLKKLVRRHGATHDISADLYLSVLTACTANRLQGARAAEPARKILDQLADLYCENKEVASPVRETVGNYCIQNSLGSSIDTSTHQGFGGVDTALAMKAALEVMNVPFSLETMEKIAVALAKEGSAKDALEQLKIIITDRLETPSLIALADMAQAVASSSPDEMATLLGYVKAAGYELDQLSSTQEGVRLLAYAVIAAEKINNAALGLRLLTAAGTTEGMDVTVATYNQDSRRSAIRLHHKAIYQAVKDDQWKLAVKVLTIQLERQLRPSATIWRTVVTCCARAQKSKRATALLLDWVRLYEEGNADIPPLTVFNTCMNACEICGEEELTLLVLDAMKKTHDTEGNLITFNIALKRLARQGNHIACEGIIVGMLQEGIEPSVVSYTTAVAACAFREHRQPAAAMEWIRRMRSRQVNPNVLTYNTAFSTCGDGKPDDLKMASTMAQMMLTDAGRQLADSHGKFDQYTNVLPDATTRLLAKELLDKAAALGDDEILPPLKQLSEFQAEPNNAKAPDSEEQVEDQAKALELDLEFKATSSTHRVAEV